MLGLHCQRCIGSVERRIKALPGVHAVLVDAPTKRVIVVYEEACCDRTRVEWVIYNEGYDVTPDAESFRPGDLSTTRDCRRHGGLPGGATTTISW